MNSFHKKGTLWDAFFMLHLMLMLMESKILICTHIG